MLFAVAPSAALCEEIVYRGLFLVLLKGPLGFWPANLIQSALFGFHHGGLKQGPLLRRSLR